MIYLDANATTQLAPEAFETMRPFLMERFGNPSSRHGLGSEARAAIERARAGVASFIGANPGDVAFTSSGTESVGMAFQCALEGRAMPVLVSAVEHACVLEASELWGKRGRTIQTLPIDEQGRVDPAILDEVLRQSGPAFVSLIWVNNETGVISPIRELAEVCRNRGALLHVDAIQAIARVEIDVRELSCDYLSIAAHKFNGPKGAAALYLRPSAPRHAMFPGHQENGLRGGTENVPAIVGMGEAIALKSDWTPLQTGMARLRDQLESKVLHAVKGAEVNGGEAPRVANTSNIFFPGKSAADLVAGLARAGVYASAGAACSTGGRPSHVLLAMGLPAARANGSVRFSLDLDCESAGIEYAAEAIVSVFNSVPDSGRVA